MQRPLLTSRTVTRIAFGLIILFVLAQVVWWIVFQQRYINRVTETTFEAWQQTADAATRVAQSTRDDELIWSLIWDYPYLLYDELDPELYS